MKCKGLLFNITLMLATYALTGQISPECGGAIPICNDTPVNGGTQGYGTDDFNGAQMSGCLEQTTSGAIESNSAWYRFRTGATGELGFTIGFDASEDWDFALYQTNDCGNLGDPVRCNFFDNSDQESFMGVGAHPAGNTATVLFEDWLQVTPGQDYYLMINNFSNTNSGFSIQFTGGIFQTNPFDALDCSIISNLLGPPVATCQNDVVILDATTPDAFSYLWYEDTGNGFQPISGAVNATLQVFTSAQYRAEVHTPSLTLYSDVQVGFTPTPTTSPLTDEEFCTQGGVFDLGSKDGEALGIQDPASFFVSYHNSQSDADLGLNALPRQLNLVPGVRTIFVRTTSVAGSDCYDSSQHFMLGASVQPVLDFPSEVPICESGGSVVIGDESPVPGYTYLWDTGAQTPTITVTAAGSYTATVTNSAGGLSCISTQTVNVVTSVTPTIAEIIVNDLQQANTVEVITGDPGDFQFQLDSGVFQESPYFSDVAPGLHAVTVRDTLNCGSVTERFTVMGFPRFFTPNGDGNNDFWGIEGMSILQNPIVLIFDRFGKLLRQLTPNSPSWDGTSSGRKMPSADYWFSLTYTDTDGQRVEANHLNSHFSLKR
jgi:gliding motility-associated-like protein